MFWGEGRFGAGDLVWIGCYTTKGVAGYDLTRLIGSEERLP
ncbi:MAG: hypothetical protein U1E63_02085 [Burkholderiales bacterium]